MKQNVTIPLILMGKNLFSKQMLSLFRVLTPWNRKHNIDGELYFSFPNYGIELLFDSKWILTAIYYNIFNKKYSQITYCNEILDKITPRTRPIDIKKQLKQPFLSVRGDHNYDKWKLDQYIICTIYNGDISKIKLIVANFSKVIPFPCPPMTYPVFK